MSERKRKSGRDWIEKTLLKFTKDAQISLRDLRWGSTTADPKIDRLTLATDTQRVIEPFRWETLEACSDDPKVQAQVEERLLKRLMELIIADTSPSVLEGKAAQDRDRAVKALASWIRKKERFEG